MMRRFLMLLALAGLLAGCAGSVTGPDEASSGERVVQPAGGTGANDGG